MAYVKIRIYPWKWSAWYSIPFWYKNELSIPDQKTRLNFNLEEEKNLSTTRFFRTMWKWRKAKCRTNTWSLSENGKCDETWRGSDTNRCWSPWNSLHWAEKITVGLEICGGIETIQTTTLPKSARILRRVLKIREDTSKNHQLELVWKTCNDQHNNNND